MSMKQYMTKEAIQLVNEYIESNSLLSLIQWVNKISSITKGKSGFYGVSFKVLIPYLENLKIK